MPGLFNNIIRVLAHPLLYPKAQYLDPAVQKNRLKEPSILVSNHTGHLDGAVLNTVFGKDRIYSLAAKDRFNQKGFGFFLRHTYCIPIDRENLDTSWIHAAIEVLNVKKQNIAIYPEGRHGQHRQQLPFHSGAVTLAILSGAPIVMAYLDGPFKFFRRNDVFVGTPFRIERPEGGITADYVEEQTHLLEQKMRDLMQAYIDRNSQTI